MCIVLALVSAMLSGLFVSAILLWVNSGSDRPRGVQPTFPGEAFDPHMPRDRNGNPNAF